MSQDETHVKIRIPPTEEVDHGERLWAIPVAEGLYQLDNIPSEHYGYALGDIVQCKNVDGTMPEVTGMHQDNGNGTIWLFFVDFTSLAAKSLLDELVSVGCSYERFTEQFAGVNVPVATDVPFPQSQSI